MREPHGCRPMRANVMLDLQVDEMCALMAQVQMRVQREVQLRG